uniref:RING-type E3 ubiquitin transferase n=1 Tax=Ananas comosus var. bracteatus TaxID=296719 RepID=A0A6V7P7A8_ANACO|nr:unnamed protein product [Ananas comosus var. bracteatus]
MASSSSEMRAAAALAGAVREISALGGGGPGAASGELGAERLRLARKVSLLSHLLDEIVEFLAGKGAAAEASSSAADPMLCLEELLRALETAKRFLLLGLSPPPSPPLHLENAASDVRRKYIALQLKYVTWQLERALGNFPFDYFGVSDEIQEQVELVRVQLRRGMEKKGTPDVNIFSEIHGVLYCRGEDIQRQVSTESVKLETENIGDYIQILREIVVDINGKSSLDYEGMVYKLIERFEKPQVVDSTKSVKAPHRVKKSTNEAKKPESLVIPEDFRCPISLELMRDPVIVSTGQTYDRAYIQRWIDCGNQTCPKTQQRLQNLILTPNYVLKSLIMQWCEKNRIEQPGKSISGWIRKNDGSYEVSGDRMAIDALIRNLCSSSLEEQRSAAAEIRSMAKRSTESRILLSEAGAISALVNTLSSKDPKLQEHAVTSLLNLSIYDPNKELIVLAGAILPIIQVLKMGSMEARENAAAAIFSLSLTDENKITIGSTQGVMEALVGLLKGGSTRGKKDAATALFNLCIYQANKVHAVKAGILKPLVEMLQDSSGNGMVDEALTILSVLVSHKECKAAIAKANMIPLLVDLLRTGQPRNKENAAAVLLALCKKDAENLACIGGLGAAIPLTELTKSGTDRAKRKATSLLEHLGKLQML